MVVTFKQEKPEWIKATHSKCGRRSVMDFKGGVGIRCTWCGVAIQSCDEIIQIPPRKRGKNANETSE